MLRKVIATSLRETLGAFSDALTDAVDPSSRYEMGEVRLILRISAKGEVSIVSLAKGGVNAETGVEVILRRREVT